MQEKFANTKKVIIFASESGDMVDSCQTRRMYGHDYAVPGTYERFHYLNRLAEAVCAIGHTTNVAVRGLRLANGG